MVDDQFLYCLLFVHLCLRHSFDDKRQTNQNAAYHCLCSRNRMDSQKSKDELRSNCSKLHQKVSLKAEIKSQIGRKTERIEQEEEDIFLRCLFGSLSHLSTLPLQPPHPLLLPLPLFILTK